MSDSTAQAIWDILVRYAGASPFLRDSFCCRMLDDSDQFRFGGDLDFGGRLHVEPGHWWVDTYAVLMPLARIEAICIATNAALEGLRMRTEGIHE